MQASKKPSLQKCEKKSATFLHYRLLQKRTHTHAWTNTREKENRLNWTSAQNNNWNENKHMGE